MENKNSQLWIVAVAISVSAVIFVLFRSNDPAPSNGSIVSPAPAPTPLSVKPAPSTLATSLSVGEPKIPAPKAGASASPSPTIASTTRPAPIIPRPAPSDPDTPPSPPPAPEKPADRAQARDVVDRVQFVIRDYRLALGGNPVGDNEEITRALLGSNAKQVRFAVPEGSQVNGQGQLCDPWGTPYFFHALAKDRMEVRSAGADRRMWTADDVQQ